MKDREWRKVSPATQVKSREGKDVWDRCSDHVPDADPVQRLLAHYVSVEVLGKQPFRYNECLRVFESV